MSINGVGNAQYFIAKLGVLDPFSTDTSTDPLLSANSTGNTAAAGYDPMLDTGTDSTTATAQNNISSAASLLSSLAQLQKQNPAAFKEATSEISASLREAAGQSTDTVQSYSLGSLADKFSNAAATGSLTAVSASKTANSLRGYGTSSNLVTTFLSPDMDPNLFGAVSDLVESKLSSVLSDS